MATTARELGDKYTTALTDTGLPLGRTALYTSNTGQHAGNLRVNLVPKADRTISDVEAVEKVRRATEELGYRPNLTARALRARRSHAIGFAPAQREMYSRNVCFT